MRINRTLLALLLIAVVGSMLFGCKKTYTPRPYSYYRIALPDTGYVLFAEKGSPYTFEYSEAGKVVPQMQGAKEQWLNIDYPTLNATVHCSYRPIEGNLAVLLQESHEFVYKHASQANAIPEHFFENRDAGVFGIFYEIYGNTASPIQFILTDSSQHFFRGALYFNSAPNQDSLAPVVDYLRGDMLRLVESFEWRRTK